MSLSACYHLGHAEDRTRYNIITQAMPLAATIANGGRRCSHC
jgi:hypothetical protein